jgi:hypothetical protein
MVIMVKIVLVKNDGTNLRVPTLLPQGQKARIQATQIHYRSDLKN